MFRRGKVEKTAGVDEKWEGRYREGRYREGRYREGRYMEGVGEKGKLETSRGE